MPLDKKKITKLLLQDELRTFEALPISLEVDSGEGTPAFSVTRVRKSNNPTEAILTLRLYDRESIQEAIKLTDSTFFGKYAIVRLPDEV